jgi:hypothetical protein
VSIAYVVSSGTTSSGLNVDAAAVATVLVYGTAVSTTVYSGGFAGIYASGTTVNNGGNDSEFGGTAIGTTVNSGGQEFVCSGGVASFTKPRRPGELPPRAPNGPAVPGLRRPVRTGCGDDVGDTRRGAPGDDRGGTCRGAADGLAKRTAAVTPVWCDRGARGTFARRDEDLPWRNESKRDKNMTTAEI